MKLPLDVRGRRFVAYAVQLSCARQVWVAMRGTRVASRWGPAIVRHLLRPAGGPRHRRIRKLMRR
jgi:hypothetical protein